MMKKYYAIILVAASFIAGSIKACAFFVENDTANLVHVFDKNTEKPQVISPGQTEQVGTNPNIHANFVVSVLDESTPRFFTVEQVACSQSHRIVLSLTNMAYLSSPNKEDKEQIPVELRKIVRVKELAPVKQKRARYGA